MKLVLQILSYELKIVSWRVQFHMDFLGEDRNKNGTYQCMFGKP